MVPACSEPCSHAIERLGDWVRGTYPGGEAKRTCTQGALGEGYRSTLCNGRQSFALFVNGMPFVRVALDGSRQVRWDCS